MSVAVSGNRTAPRPTPVPAPRSGEPRYRASASVRGTARSDAVDVPQHGAAAITDHPATTPAAEHQSGGDMRVVNLLLAALAIACVLAAALGSILH